VIAAVAGIFKRSARSVKSFNLMDEIALSRGNRRVFAARNCFQLFNHVCLRNRGFLDCFVYYETVFVLFQ